VSVCMYVCMYICPCVHWWPRPMREQWIRKGHRFFQWLRWHGDLAARLNGGALVTLMKIPNSEFQWAVSRHRERRLRPWHTASKLGPSGHNFGCTPPPPIGPSIHPSNRPRPQSFGPFSAHEENGTECNVLEIPHKICKMLPTLVCPISAVSEKGSWLLQNYLTCYAIKYF